MQEAVRSVTDVEGAAGGALPIPIGPVADRGEVGERWRVRPGPLANDCRDGGAPLIGLPLRLIGMSVTAAFDPPPTLVRLPFGGPRRF
jgi:hypothetical protein